MTRSLLSIALGVIAIAMVLVAMPTTKAHSACLGLLTIARFDKNNDLKVNYAEFKALAKWRFSNLDKNKDGKLSRREAPKGKIHPAFGSEQDQFISKSKYQRATGKFFRFVDRNSDKSLSLGEYNRLCRENWAF